MRLINKIAIIAALGTPLTFAPLAFAQDTSGNSLLQGSYRFRYVAPLNYNSAGNITEVIAANGVITFNGSGTYTIAQGSNYIDNTQNSGNPQEFPAESGGTYGIGDNGLGYISSPLANISSSFSGVADFGTFSSSSGVFTGSSTYSGLNDLFVVMSVGPIPTNSTFTSPYWLGVLDFSGGGDVLVKNASLEITPNGAGGLGIANLTGFDNDYQSGTLLTQTVTGATYNFASDGGATLTLPLPSGVTANDALFSGSRIMYVSTNGNFVLGWNPNGYDIFFGVTALAPNTGTDSLFSGLYYLGNLSDVPQQCGAESFWGSINADGMENEVMHQQLFSAVCSDTGTGESYDYGTDDSTVVNSDGTAIDELGNYYAFGDSGNAFISVSNSPGLYSLTIGIHAPSFSGSGVYLSPIGVINGASWDPITASYAPGELVTLFGTDLASSSVTSQGGSPFPTALGPTPGATQVLVNGQPAPLYYVSPTQVSAILPYELVNSTAYTAEVQVNNGGILSNQVSISLTDAESGIFSQGQNGIGDAIALDATTSSACNCVQYVTENNPANPGDTITLALTGMGTVTPAIADGAVGPTNPLSYADNYSNSALVVYFNDYVNNSIYQQATVGYAGLYPGLAGLYQMNVTVPTTVGPGDVYVEVVTDLAANEQVTIPVAAVASAAKLHPQPAAYTLARLPQQLLHVKAPPHTTRTVGVNPAVRRGFQAPVRPAAPFPAWSIARPAN